MNCKLLNFILYGICAFALVACGGSDSKSAKEQADALVDELLLEMESKNHGETADLDEPHESFDDDDRQPTETVEGGANEASGNAANMLSYEDASGRTIYTRVSKMPSFPGGNEEIYRYLHNNLNYPKEAEQTVEEAKAFIQFIVDEAGKIEQVEITRSSGFEMLDAEALRVISAMPDWSPGQQDGQPVLVKYILPVIFKLN